MTTENAANLTSVRSDCVSAPVVTRWTPLSQESSVGNVSRSQGSPLA